MKPDQRAKHPRGRTAKPAGEKYVTVAMRFHPAIAARLRKLASELQTSQSSLVTDWIERHTEVTEVLS